MSTYADRVKETATAPGTGTVTPGGAVAGYQSFSTAVTAGQVVQVCIEEQTPGAWEVCDALWNGTTLVRGEIAGSSTGVRVNFGGAVNVFITPTSRSLAGTRRGAAMQAALGNTGVI